jgi:hypothetical protein
MLHSDGKTAHYGPCANCGKRVVKYAGGGYVPIHSESLTTYCNIQDIKDNRLATLRDEDVEA